MPAYALGNLIPPARLADEVLSYMERIQATLDPFDGRFLVHGAPEREVREGDWPGALVIIGFPSMDAARGWYDSPAYQELIPLRTRHMTGDILLIDGVGEGYEAAATAAFLREAQAAGERT
ncbi:DUF1330 domain-containing protein [Streptomyces qinzhouensis]|uniref:DUF1330 domain-containing protein n=1 Tax=Streptomyces qinzhouensis TaxID=2599401 RepID=A0A5B8J421_9ACTN|nr:DUF1330 domain-containing protein [Streptomyces qinzhouensis]QDY75164.1 DUF1330 domain-containing protein [Streptomyces qinzhouensis]QDY80634.1 DUF1330 domain-containing protein [Streptomyces qinzhouensis]